VVAALEEALAKSAHGRRMQFNIALNYSGRTEIVDACRKIVANFAAGQRVEIDEAAIAAALSTAGSPDPDLLIRTSGELRISNFLLWQIAYSEIWVTPTYWPDFRLRHLLEAIVEYQSRERRFGDVSAGDRGAAPLPGVADGAKREA
jgi:undecaprenyl diphosphate synthase